MLKTEQSKRLLIKSNGLKGLYKTLAVIGLISFCFCIFIFQSSPAVYASAANQINFQARLEQSSGAIVPDGSYNVTFHIFNSSNYTTDTGASTDTTCTNSTICLWEESYTYSTTQLAVSNGYLTANLGSITALPANIWNQQLWLSIDIGGTTGSGTITWDGQMNPVLQLTAVPTAFSLSTYNNSTGYSSTLALIQPTGGNQTFQVDDQTATGTYTVCIQGGTTGNGGCAPVTGGTGYIQNQNSSPQAANFYINGTGQAATLQGNTNVLTPTLDSISGALSIGTTTATGVTIGNTTNTSSISLTGNNGATISIGNISNSTANTTTVSIATSNDAAQTIDIGGAGGATGSNSTTQVVTQAGQTAETLLSSGLTVQTYTNSTNAFQVENSASTPLTELNVDTQNNRVGSGQLSQVTGASDSAQVSGSLVHGTYYFKVTAQDAAGGQSLPSSEVNASTSVSCTGSGSCEVSVSWTAVTGAITYDVYYGTSPGGETHYINTGSNATSYVYSTSSPAGNVAASPPTTGYAFVNQLTGSASGTNYLTNSLVQTATNSATAFQVQNASGTSLLQVDTGSNNLYLGGNSSLTGNSTTAVNIGAVSTASYSSTINIGSASGGTQSVTVGSTNGSSALTLQSGSGNLALSTGSTTGNITLTTNNASSSIIAKSSTASTTAIQLQNANAISLLTLDSTNSRIDIAGAGASTSVYSSSVNTAGQLFVAGTIPNSQAQQTTDLSAPTSIYVQGTYAYIVNSGNSELAVYNIAIPTSPTAITDSSTDLSTPQSVYVQGQYAYIADSTNGLVVYNIANPDNPTAVAKVNTNLSSASSVYVQGNYAYVASKGNNELDIFNVSNPNSPVYVGQSSTNLNDPISVFVKGNYAYVLNDNSGGGGSNPSALAIFNVSNPASPSNTSVSTSHLNQPISLFVQGNYAYVVNNASSGTDHSELVTFNISNPGATLTALTTISTNLSTPQQVYVQGRYAYVADPGTGKLAVFDVSSPSSLVSLGASGNLIGVSGVFVQGRYAYGISSGQSTIATFDSGGAYVQQLQAGGAEVGTLTVDSNGTVAGDLGIQGGLSVGSNTELDSNLGVAGAALFEDSTNSATAFQIQNTSGTSLLQVDTNGNNVYLGGNSSLTGTTTTTVNIGAVSTASYQSTINIGTASGAIQNVTVGSTDSSSALTLQAGSGNLALTTGSTTGNITLTTNNSSSSIIAKTSTNSATALSLQNANSDPLVQFDDTTANSDLIADPQFVIGSGSTVSEWNAQTGATVSQNTTQSNTYFGQDSMSITTATTAGKGSVYDFSSSQGAGTYSFSFYAMVSSSSSNFSDLEVLVGGTSGLCNLNNTNVITNGFTQYACTFTDGSSFSNINIAESGTTSHVFYVDGVSLVSSSTVTPYSTGNIQLRGNITTPVTIAPVSSSTTALQVENTINQPILVVNSDATSNLITNPGFVAGTSGWTSTGTTGSSIFWNRNPSNAYGGQASLLVTSGTAGSSSAVGGAKVTTFNSSITPGSYILTFYAGDGSSAFTDLGVTFTGGASSGGNATCSISSATISTSGFSEYSCSFTSVSSNVTAIAIGETGTTSHTFYLDAAQLLTGSTITPYNVGSLQLRGVISNPVAFQNTTNSNTAFSIYNANSQSLFNTDTLNATVEVGSYGSSSLASIVDVGISTGATQTINIGGTSGNASPNGTNIFLQGGNGSSAVSIQANSNGTIGIGNTNPDTILVGNTTSTNTLTLQGDNISQVITGAASNPSDIIKATSTLALEVQNSGGTNLLQVDTSGNNVYLGDNSSSSGTNGTVVNVGAVGTEAYTSTSNLGTSTGAAQTIKIGGTGGSGSSNTSSSVIAQAGQTELSLANTGAAIETFSNSVTAFQIQNSAGSSGALFTGDTSNMRIGVDVTYSSMSVPSISSTSTATTGGTLAQNTTYYYEITAIDANGGETTPSSQAARLTGNTTATNTITLTWAPITGAAAYHIYRSTTSGTFTGVGYYSAVGIASGGNVTFTDTGASQNNTSASPPGSNSAYSSSNISNTNNLELSVGGNGTPSGQVYVSGTVPTAPVATIPTGSFPFSVYVEGRYAYEVNGTGNTLGVYDVSNPAAPINVNSVSTGAGSGPESVYVQGRYAYVLDSSTGQLAIYDISNPTVPNNVGHVSTGFNGGPESVYVQGRYAYVVNNSTSTNGAGDTLVIIDISNPALPTAVGSVSTGANSAPSSVYVQGRYAYVTDFTSNTFAVFDVSNPAAPVGAGSVFTGAGSNPQSVYVQGSYAYVTDLSSNLLAIYNVSDPTTSTPPVLVGSVSSSGAQSVYVQGNYAYVANTGANNMGVYNVSNPAAPVSVGTVSTGSGSDPSSVFVQGRYAYVTSELTNNLSIFDLGGEYTQQLAAGGIETDTLQVDTNAQIAGDASVQGGLTASKSFQDGGDLGVAGNASIQGATSLIGGIQGGLVVSGLSTPSAPTVTPAGVPGSATYAYEVAAVAANGLTTPASASGQTTTGFSPLSGVNANAVSWTPVAGAVEYDVYRTSVSGGGSPSSTGFIGSTAAATFSDSGLAASGSTPTTDSSGELTVSNDINSTTGFTISGAATSGNFLRGNGTQFVSSAIQAGDIPAGSTHYIQNQSSTAQSANFDIQGSTSGKPAALIQGDSGTDDIVDFKTSGGLVDSFDDNGNLNINGSSDLYLNGTGSGGILYLDGTSNTGDDLWSGTGTTGFNLSQDDGDYNFNDANYGGNVVTFTGNSSGAATLLLGTGAGAATTLNVGTTNTSGNTTVTIEAASTSSATLTTTTTGSGTTTLNVGTGGTGNVNATFGNATGNALIDVAGHYTLEDQTPTITGSSCWGSTATKTLTGAQDQNGELDVLSQGTGQCADPTVTVSYADTSWGSHTPYPVLTPFNSVAAGDNYYITVANGTSFTFVVLITPAAGQHYEWTFEAL